MGAPLAAVCPPLATGRAGAMDALLAMKDTDELSDKRTTTTAWGKPRDGDTQVNFRGAGVQRRVEKS